AQAVPVGDFDQGYASVVQAAGDGFHLVQRHQVALGVHAVTQGHVVDGDFCAFECGHEGLRIQATTGLSTSSPLRISSANISAVRAGAAVMMSRLPAYLGR